MYGPLLIVVLIGAGVADMTACDLDSGVTIVAHRGSMQDGFPENTLAAIQRAHQIGISTVELDVRAARDGEPILIHDASLRRTTDGVGSVRDLTVEQIQQFDAGQGNHVPTLAEGLTAAHILGLTVLLDFKETESLDMVDVTSNIQGEYAQDTIIFGVRTIDALKQVRQVNPAARVLGFVRTIDQVGVFINEGADIIRLWGHRVISSPQLVREIQQQHTQVWVTSGKRKGTGMQRILASGVDGVITDVPDHLLAENCCC